MNIKNTIKQIALIINIKNKNKDSTLYKKQ